MQPTATVAVKAVANTTWTRMMLNPVRAAKPRSVVGLAAHYHHPLRSSTAAVTLRTTLNVMLKEKTQNLDSAVKPEENYPLVPTDMLVLVAHC